MANTAVLTEGAATIVADDVSRFSWGITIAGAVAATATSFFLITLGTGVGLGFVTLPASRGETATLLTLGAIWFFASQAFGFAVGGYLVGRLIGPQVESSKEEEFRAAAHGLTMWAVAVVASLLLAAASSTLAGSVIAGSIANRGEMAGLQAYWVDDMFRPAPYSAQVTADKAESARILAAAGTAPLSESDSARIAHLVAQDAGISMQAGLNRVSDAQSEMRAAAEKARKAAMNLSLWIAFALLFGAIVSVAAAISARWMDDRITFSMAPRH